MRNYKTSKWRFGAAAAGAMAVGATLLSTHDAHAEYLKTASGGQAWTYGNDNFMTVVSPTSSSLVTGYLDEGLPYYKTRDQNTFHVYAQVLGAKGYLIWTEASGVAETRRGKYATVGGRVKLVGKQIYSPDPEGQVGCPPSSEADTACFSYDKDLSFTFFTVPVAEFMLGFVPVYVSGSVGGGVYGHLSAQSTAMQGLPTNKNHHLGLIGIKGASGAYASASLSAEAGITGVLSVGVTTTFKLIDVSGVVSNSVMHRNDDTLKRFIADYNLGFNVKTMAGKVDVWAQITPFFKPTQNLINIAGISKYVPIEDKTVSLSVPAVTP